MPTDSLPTTIPEEAGLPAQSSPSSGQPTGRWSRPDNLLHMAVGIVAALSLAAFVLAVTRRARYPFELEWMEGAVLDHVRVLLDGRPLYRAPSIEFTPYIYTPFYYAVCAAFGRVFGVGLLLARVVSITSIFGCFLLLADFVRRETGNRSAALVAAGLFAATYELTGFWFDIARVDSLFLLLLLLGTWLARFGRSYASALGAALALFLAFFTKQTGLVLAAPALVFALATHRRRGLVASGAFVALLLTSITALHRGSNGWFTYYVFGAPSQHDMLWDRWRDLLVQFFWAPVAVPVLFAILALLSRAVRDQGRAVWLLYLLLTVLGVGTSYSSLLHRDGFVNVLIPGYAVLALMTGLGYAWVLRETSSRPGSAMVALRCFAAASLLLAFAVLAYDVRRAIPTSADVRASRQMIESLRATPGPVWMPGSGFLASSAGHPEINAHAMALADIFKTRDAETKNRLRDDMLRAIRDKRYPSIVLDRGWEVLPPEMAREVRANYKLASKLFPTTPEAGWPRTGFHTRPDELWLPR